MPTPGNQNTTKPPYYKSGYGDIDVIDICFMFELPFAEGNVIKYIIRDKDDKIEDLEKAKEYIDRIIKDLKSKNK